MPREQREATQWAAQIHAMEAGQNAFWAKVGRNYPEETKSWAAQMQATEDGQSAFWSGILEAPAEQVRDE